MNPSRFPAPSPLLAQWTLDPSVVFLNHGSFGATPRAVLEARHRYEAMMEREPVSFFVEHLEPLMDSMRAELAAFLRCRPEAIAPMPNASIAVATVIESSNLSPGDEILITEHEYPACQNSLRRAAARRGASVVKAPLPFPCPSPHAAAESILSAVTPRTRLVMLSHVTSPSGMILPVEPLVRELESRGVRVLVDGAHAAGMIPTLDLDALGASYYCGNCHKWICSPKGSAFLYVRSDLRQLVRPLALSNNAEKPKPGRSQFLTEFDYIGTQDYSSILAIPDALRIMPTFMPGGWPAIMRHNHDLVLAGRKLVCEALGVEPPCPETMIGSIATIVLPPHAPERHARLMARPSRYHDALQDALVTKHRIQVPVWGVPGHPARFLRLSAQLYTTMEQYHYLVDALKAELALEAAY
jgi:isopenicillin-N epimerase